MLTIFENLEPHERLHSAGTGYRGTQQGWRLSWHECLKVHQLYNK